MQNGDQWDCLDLHSNYSVVDEPPSSTTAPDIVPHYNLKMSPVLVPSTRPVV